MNADSAQNMTEQRQHVHAYIDRLPGDQLSAVYNLLETMLSQLDRTLARAPVDDEPVTPEDKAAIEEGVASLDAGSVVPMEEVLADFGLTMNDFRNMASGRESSG